MLYVNNDPNTSYDCCMLHKSHKLRMEYCKIKITIHLIQSRVHTHAHKHTHSPESGRKVNLMSISFLFHRTDAVGTHDQDLDVPAQTLDSDPASSPQVSLNPL